MARRSKRRAAARPRPTPLSTPPPAPAPLPEPELEVVESDGSEQPAPEAAAAPAAQPRPQAGSFLPRRGGASAAVREAPASTQTFLPTRSRITGRAERQRIQSASLEPLDESPAVPVDRTPYLRLDLRRVLLVSGVMLLLVILGSVFLH